MSQDNLFKALLAEAEAKRIAQEARADAVKAAKRAELQALSEECDKAMKRAPKGFKPVPSLKPQRGLQLAMCKRNHALIVEMMGRGESFAETARAISKLEGDRLEQVTVNNYCKANGIEQVEKPTWHNLLTPHLESIRDDVEDGLTRHELSIKYNAPLSSLGDFLKHHGISTAKGPTFKLDLGSLKRRDWT